MHFFTARNKTNSNILTKYNRNKNRYTMVNKNQSYKIFTVKLT